MMGVICPVCTHSAAERLGDMRWNIDGVEYTLAKCSCCECAFTNPQPDDATLSRFYRTAFNYNWYLDHFGAKILDCQMRMEEYRDIVGSRILDYGGGLGYFSLVARLRGLHAVTYDPYTTNLEPETSAWDSVVVLHVLEHSNNLDRTIQHIKRFPVPGGKIILAVPNYRCSGYQKLGMAWVWAQPPMMHLFHFTAAGIEKLLRRQNLSIESVSYHERWDANRIADLEQVETMRRQEAEWSSDMVNPFPVKRALIAWRNSLARMKYLQLAKQEYNSESEQYSELQVIAKLDF
jgi:SAM-dependent methyltransferase